MAQKILVVNQKAFMMRLIQHHLTKAGYELIPARNSKEAAEAIQRENPSLMVVDEGSACAQSLQTNESTSPLPVIRMTNVPPGMNDDDHLPGDGEIVLTTPFSPTQLVEQVRRLVKKRDGTNG